MRSQTTRFPIHRADLRGRPMCGATADSFGRLYISTSGARHSITCPSCVGPSEEEIRAAQLADLAAAAARYRARQETR